MLYSAKKRGCSVILGEDGNYFMTISSDLLKFKTYKKSLNCLIQQFQIRSPAAVKQTTQTALTKCRHTVLNKQKDTLQGGSKYKMCKYKREDGVSPVR